MEGKSEETTFGGRRESQRRVKNSIDSFKGKKGWRLWKGRVKKQRSAAEGKANEERRIR